MLADSELKRLRGVGKKKEVQKKVDSQKKNGMTDWTISGRAPDSSLRLNFGYLKEEELVCPHHKLMVQLFILF